MYGYNVGAVNYMRRHENQMRRQVEFARRCGRIAERDAQEEANPALRTLLVAPAYALRLLANPIGIGTRRQQGLTDQCRSLVKQHGHFEGDYGFITVLGFRRVERVLSHLTCGGCYERAALHSVRSARELFKFADWPLQPCNHGWLPCN